MMSVTDTQGVAMNLLLSIAVAAFAQAPAQTAAPCVQQGNTQYVCGQTAPEDLVLVPGGEWVIASVYGGTGGIRIINTKDKSTTAGYPAPSAREELDKKTYDTCPGPPDAEQKANMRTHGLAIREGRNMRHTLYVVNHTKRESIEVFELNANVRPPLLTWIGCAVVPDPIGLNSVVPLPDGGFIGTDYLARNDNTARARMTAGEVNGALWEWHTGKGWTKVAGSDASGPNGLELSKDGKTLFVNAWGGQSFFRLSLDQTPVKRDTVQLDFRPDNVRWAPDGSLFVIGQGGAGQMQTTRIVKIDPATLKITEVLTRLNTPEFGAGTVAIQIGKELWIGSYRGDRLAIVPAP
jgi:hypothetical protein